MTEPPRPAFAEPRLAGRRTAILAAALTVPAVIIATQLYVGSRLTGSPIAFGAWLVVQLCHWEIWTIAGPFVWRLERRWPIAPPRRRRAIACHAIAAPIVAAAVLLTYVGLYHVIVRVPIFSPWFTGMDRSLSRTAIFFAATYLHVELLVYGAIVAAAHAARTGRLLRDREHEALRLEAELTGAKLTALRTQLQPHFLFNTLHTIGSLVLQRQPDRAVSLLAELGELLRGTLAHRETDLAPLRDEIAYLHRYLRIEEARFGDRLTIRWDIDPAALDALIPPFILQPLVENAFRHGIARRTEPSLLRIAAAADDGMWRITVYNDGPPLPEPFTFETAGNGDRGYGLQNVRARLQTRRPAGRLELANVDGGVFATLVVPRWDASGERSA